MPGGLPAAEGRAPAALEGVARAAGGGGTAAAAGAWDAPTQLFDESDGSSGSESDGDGAAAAAAGVVGATPGSAPASVLRALRRGSQGARGGPARELGAYLEDEELVAGFLGSGDWQLYEWQVGRPAGLAVCGESGRVHVGGLLAAAQSSAAWLAAHQAPGRGTPLHCCHDRWWPKCLLPPACAPSSTPGRVPEHTRRAARPQPGVLCPHQRRQEPRGGGAGTAAADTHGPHRPGALRAAAAQRFAPLTKPRDSPCWSPRASPPMPGPARPCLTPL